VGSQSVISSGELTSDYPV